MRNEKSIHHLQSLKHIKYQKWQDKVRNEMVDEMVNEMR